MKKIKVICGEFNLPMCKSKGAAAHDCYASLSEDVVINPGETRLIPLGIRMEIPKGYYVEVRGRSGLATKGILVHTGTVDCDYRGEVCAIMTNVCQKAFTVKNLERVAQMQLKKVEKFKFKEVSFLSDTERGNKGFGSTGM